MTDAELVMRRCVFDQNWATLFGAAGIPRLAGSGSLSPGGVVSFGVSQAAPLAATTLFVGLEWLGLHFKGGVIGPTPGLVLAGLVPDAAGQLSLGAHWPSGVPAGFTFFLQAWVADAAAIKGAAATNDLLVTTP